MAESATRCHMGKWPLTLVGICMTLSTSATPSAKRPSSVGDDPGLAPLKPGLGI